MNHHVKDTFTLEISIMYQPRANGLTLVIARLNNGAKYTALIADATVAAYLDAKQSSVAPLISLDASQLTIGANDHVIILKSRQ